MLSLWSILAPVMPAKAKAGTDTGAQRKPVAETARSATHAIIAMDGEG